MTPVGRRGGTPGGRTPAWLAVREAPDPAAAARAVPCEVAPRLDRLRERLAALGVDAVVVADRSDVRYLCGFTGSAGVLVVGPDRAVLVTDGRYETQAAEQIAAAGARVDVEVGATGDQRRRAVAAACGSGTVGLQADVVTWAEAVDLTRALGREPVALTGLTAPLRAVKDGGELARITAAAAIADAALAEVVPMLTEGATERAVAFALETAMRRRGADDVSFPTIVASGPGAAEPHHEPTDRPVGRGDLVIIDYGALVDGYHSDATRTFAVGVPDEQRSRILEAVAAAQHLGRRAVRPGVGAAAVDAACRGALAEAGLADWFVHPTGHGVGLDIHEAPRLAEGVSDVLAPGQVVTVEPGVYRVPLGGVRIEDLLVVTDGPDGHVVLTTGDRVRVLDT